MPKRFLKHRQGALSIAIRFWLLLWALVFVSQSSVAASPNSATIEFHQVEAVFDSGLEIPQSGWKPQSIPHTWPLTDVQKRKQDYKVVWLRMKFDRSALPREPLALFTQDNREQLMIFINGTDIFRNFAEPEERTQAWYRPYLAPVPTHLLRDGENELVVRIGTRYILQAGPLVIGPERELQPRFAWQYFWRDSGVRIANYAMLALGAIAFLVWWFRRSEPEFLALAFASLVWFVNDYQFIARQWPFDEHLYVLVSDFFIYPETVATLGLCMLFVRHPRSWKTIGWAAVIGAISLALLLGGAIGIPEIYLLSFSINFFIIGMIFLAVRRSRNIEHWLALLILALLTAGAFHDLGRSKGVEWWEGLGFYVQPFNGFVFTAAYLLSFGRRALVAFSSLENVNRDLEIKVADARQELAESERVRRELEVRQAREEERERLMREVHDGIGANLVTALAVAEQEHQPANTVATLRRAISD